MNHISRPAMVIGRVLSVELDAETSVECVTALLRGVADSIEQQGRLPREGRHPVHVGGQILWLRVVNSALLPCTDSPDKCKPADFDTWPPLSAGNARSGSV